MNFLDEQGNDLLYWPVSNLPKGQNSEAIIVQVPIGPGYLRATQDVRTKVWAKWMQFPDNPYRDISHGKGINLNGITGPYSNFSIYVEALETLDNAFERVPLTVVAATGQKAGWLD